LRAMAIDMVVIGILFVLVYVSPNVYLAFAILAAVAVAANLIYGPLFALIQTLVPEPMRATSIALVYLFANFIGMGLGPLAAGALSDALRPWAAEESLRYALLILSPGYLWAAWHFVRAS